MQQGLQAVAQQMPDVVSQLSSGTDAMTVFTQQGLQVVQQTGLAQRAIAAMSGAAIPASAAVAGLATAVVIAANKFDEARDATRLYREALEETNIAATQLVASQLALAAGSDDVSGFVADLEIKTALLNGQLDNVYVTAGQLGNRLSDELEPSIRSAGMAIAENENQQQKLSEAIKSGTLGFDDYTHAVKRLEELKGARPELEQNLAALKEEAQRGREAIN